jgi:hypothetical protein
MENLTLTFKLNWQKQRHGEEQHQLHLGQVKVSLNVIQNSISGRLSHGLAAPNPNEVNETQN